MSQGGVGHAVGHVSSPGCTPLQEGFSHTARHLMFVPHGPEAGRRALLSVRDWWHGEQDWIDNPRAQIPPLIQSHGALIPKVQSELS